MTNLKRSKSHFIFGSLLILLGIGLFCYPIFKNKAVEHQDNKKIEQFFEIQDSKEETIITNKEETVTKKEISYIGILEIPSINLKKGFYGINDINNNVNRNIEIIENSDMPDVVNGTFILAGHSGSGAYSHFKNLYKLSLNDELYIYYNENRYSYKVVDIYDVEKTGKVKIKRDANKTYLVLITCRHNTNKQIVIIAELLSKDKY